MTKWEYLTLVRDVEYQPFGHNPSGYTWRDKNPKEWGERLNELGEQGWELVSAISESSRYGSTSNGTTTSITLIFKRSK